MGRNTGSEAAAERGFRALQDKIYASFGAAEPSTPVLRCRNATQTSVVLEWDPVQLATADLISLALFRNGQKAGVVPRPLQLRSTKMSGLAVDTEYTFHLVLRTSAGTYGSDRVVVRTHKMTDLSGVTITTGILPAAARDRLAAAVERIGARLADSVRIDTTHFVTTEGRGIQWEKAVELNIPVVRPEWVEACEQNGRILGVTKFYLDALQPAAPTPAPPQQPQQQKELPPAPAKAEQRPQEDGGGDDDDEDDDDTDADVAKPHDGARRKEEGGTSAAAAAAAADASDEDDEEDEKAVRQQEQKVRIDEKEKQKFALRPGAAAATGDEAAGSGDGEAADDKTAVSPGDGSSFQDVAL